LKSNNVFSVQTVLFSLFCTLKYNCQKFKNSLRDILYFMLQYTRIKYKISHKFDFLAILPSYLYMQNREISYIKKNHIILFKNWQPSYNLKNWYFSKINFIIVCSSLDYTTFNWHFSVSSIFFRYFIVFIKMEHTVYKLLNILNNE
jgi:hypothetical protein